MSLKFQFVIEIDAQKNYLHLFHIIVCTQNNTLIWKSQKVFFVVSVCQFYVEIFMYFYQKLGYAACVFCCCHALWILKILLKCHATGKFVEWEVKLLRSEFSCKFWLI